MSIIEAGDKVGRVANRTKGGTEMSADIGLRLLSLRTRRKCTREWLANAIGVTHQQIHKWEDGTNNIPLPRLRDLCIALDANWNHFLDPIDAKDRDNVIQSETAVELIEAFEAIDDTQVRRSIIELVRTLAEKFP